MNPNDDVVARRLRLRPVDQLHAGRLLGLDHLPVREQRREVKREKDRLWKYVRRNTRIAAIARRALM